MSSLEDKFNEKSSEQYLKLEDLIRKFNDEEISAINCVRQIGELFKGKKIAWIVQKVSQYLPKATELSWIAGCYDVYQDIKDKLGPIKECTIEYNAGNLSEKEFVRKIDESGISFEGRRISIKTLVSALLVGGELKEEKATELRWVAGCLDTYKAIKGQLGPIEQYIKAYNEGKLSEKELIRKIDESGISFEGRRISIKTLVSALLVGGELKEEKETTLRWIAGHYDTYKTIKGQLDPIKQCIEDYNKGKLSEKELARKIDETQISFSGKKLSISTLVDALLVGGELKEEKETTLKWIAGHYDTYKDIIPYLSSHQKFYEIKDMIKKGTQEEIFNFCYAIEEEGILNYIKEKTKRNIGLSTLIQALIVGNELPYKIRIATVNAYERSKAKELQELYKEANNATHFAELVAENWNHLKDELNIKKEKPWSKRYCIGIYKAIEFRKKRGLTR